MEIDTSGAYSPDKIYGVLTAPFQPPMVTINAHTPYDKDDEAASVSLKDFHKNLHSFKYEKQTQEGSTVGIESNYKPSTVSTGEELPEFPPKSIKSFSASTSNKDIVQGALKSGYTFDQALVMTKAQRAYSSSVGITKDPIGALNSRSFRMVEP